MWAGLPHSESESPRDDGTEDNGCRTSNRDRAAGAATVGASGAVPVASPFHDWLSAQADRDDPVGDLARDYVAGIAYNEHRPADAPDGLLAILLDGSDAAQDAGVRTISEWFAATPAAKPARTRFVSRTVNEVGGFGAAEGNGDIEKVTYLCPCGAGEVVEDHDNIPGARGHDVSIRCDKCRGEWDFAPGRGVHNCSLVPM